MNTGKTLFAQLMDFLPWTTFTRIVDRYGGDHRVRTLSCAEQYRSMAFAQLTYRESLRDIETCLSDASKLYHMGFRQPVRRSTLADANERRDWRIHAALAQRLITQARTLYVDESGVGPDHNRLRPGLDDHRSVPVGLSVGALPHQQGGGEDATLLDLRGNIIHISLHSDALGSRSQIVDRRRLCPPLCVGAFFVTRAKSASMLIASISLDRGPSPWTASTPAGLPRTSAAHPLQGPRVRQDAGLHHQQLLVGCAGAAINSAVLLTERDSLAALDSGPFRDRGFNLFHPPPIETLLRDLARRIRLGNSVHRTVSLAALDSGPIIVAASCLVGTERGTSRVPDSSWSCHGCRRPCRCSGAHLLGNRANPRTCRTIGPCQRSRAEHRKPRAGHSNLTRRSHTYRAGCDGEANEHLAEEDPHNGAWVIRPATR